MVESQLLTPKEAARLIGLRPGALEYDRKRPVPVFPFIRLGRAVYYRRARLLATLKQLSRGDSHD